MSQVSKYPLSKVVEEECFDLLYQTFHDLRGKQGIKEFLDDFLSPIEQIMLAKRLGIAVLLGKGYDYVSIRKVLRVSPPTIATVAIQLKYSGMGYKRMVEKILRAEKIDAFWQNVDDVLADILPPKGKDWSYWRKDRWQRKMNNKKAL